MVMMLLTQQIKSHDQGHEEDIFSFIENYYNRIATELPEKEQLLLLKYHSDFLYLIHQLWETSYGKKWKFQLEQPRGAKPTKYHKLPKMWRPSARIAKVIDSMQKHHYVDQPVFSRQQLQYLFGKIPRPTESIPREGMDIMDTIRRLQERHGPGPWDQD